VLLDAVLMHHAPEGSIPDVFAAPSATRRSPGPVGSHVTATTWSSRLFFLKGVACPKTCAAVHHVSVSDRPSKAEAPPEPPNLSPSPARISEAPLSHAPEKTLLHQSVPPELMSLLVLLSAPFRLRVAGGFSARPGCRTLAVV